MKRRLGFCVTALITVLLAVMVLLSACGGGKPVATTPPAAPITPVASTKAPQHQLKGFDDCRSCHATGTGGAKIYPTGTDVAKVYPPAKDHSAYTSKDCLLCHNVK